MGSTNGAPTGPDLAQGVPAASLADGEMLGGHVGDDAVLLVRRGDDFHAMAGTCTHYGAPLADGIMTGTIVRCPWHHACFDVRTGEAVRAPALKPLTRYRVERRGDRVVVGNALPDTPPKRSVPAAPRSVVILGAGAAGDAAAEMLRREGYAGPITLIGAETDRPYDRPNLSKDYLAGTAPEDWIPLRPESFYAEHDITMALGSSAESIDVPNRAVRLADGTTHAFDRLLIATGASPVRLPEKITGGNVLYLRSLADSRALIERAAGAKTAVVIGASFIGLEVAAALRERKLDVHVVAPEAHPLERVLGRALSDHVKAKHEGNGVMFHLERSVAKVEKDAVVLDDGSRIPADLVVAGIGVRPNDAIAKTAGLSVDNGIVVNERLETSVPGIYAAGDVARYPDPRLGERIRVEHWVVAQRMGQVAARNMLGHAQPYDFVPFFWSAHPGSTVGYVGHAAAWDDVAVDGNIPDDDARVSYRQGGRTLAVATLGRDRESLEAEYAMERETAGAR